MASMTITPNKAYIHKTGAVNNPVQGFLIALSLIMLLAYELADEIDFLEMTVSQIFMGMEPITLIPLGFLSFGLSFIFIPDVVFDKETGSVKVSYYGFKAYYLCPLEEIAAINYTNFSGTSWKKEAGLLLKNGKYVKVLAKRPMTEMDEIVKNLSGFLGVEAYEAPDFN